MPMKTCKYCGIVPMNHRCPVARKEKADKDNMREESTKVYRTTRWNNTRVEVLENQEHICLWSLYIHGKIRQCNTVHHIIELTEDINKAYDLDNLIGLCKDSHNEVHELYKKDKRKTIEILRHCIILWNNKVRLEGLGMLFDKYRSIN